MILRPTLSKNPQRSYHCGIPCGEGQREFLGSLPVCLFLAIHTCWTVSGAGTFRCVVHKLTGSPVTATVTPNLFVPLIVIPSPSPAEEGGLREKVFSTLKLFWTLYSVNLFNFLTREVAKSYFLYVGKAQKNVGNTL